MTEKHSLHEVHWDSWWEGWILLGYLVSQISVSSCGCISHRTNLASLLLLWGINSAALRMAALISTLAEKTMMCSAFVSQWPQETSSQLVSGFFYALLTVCDKFISRHLWHVKIFFFLPYHLQTIEKLQPMMQWVEVFKLLTLVAN